MLRQTLLATCVLMLGLGVASPQPAQAFEWLFEDSPPPPAWAEYKATHPRAWFPLYRQRYGRGDPVDPYSYVSVRPAYYPYYNSGQWKEASEIAPRRTDYELPRYHKAWGRNRHDD